MLLTDMDKWRIKQMGWKSPIFMFRKDSRISHILTEDAREERLQDITLEEIKMEGISDQEILNSLPMFPPPNCNLDDIIEFMAKNLFKQLWDSLHPVGKRWEDNPEVVRLSWNYSPRLC